jgi:predicted ester cyclase
MAAADELLDDAFVIRNTGARPDKQGEKELIREHRLAFPNMRYTITHIIAEGEMVSVQLDGKATHSGKEWLGQPATGKAVNVRGDVKFTVRNGKIVEAIHNPDLLGLMADLGVVDLNAIFGAAGAAGAAGAPGAAGGGITFTRPR